MGILRIILGNTIYSTVIEQLTWLKKTPKKTPCKQLNNSIKVF